MLIHRFYPNIKEERKEGEGWNMRNQPRRKRKCPKQLEEKYQWKLGKGKKQGDSSNYSFPLLVVIYMSNFVVTVHFEMKCTHLVVFVCN